MTQPTSQEVKHTPEWKVNKIIYPAEQDVSFEVLDAAGDIVCQTIMREVIAEDERIAIDAQRVNLFAAAPEMLSALKAAEKAIVALTDQQLIDNQPLMGAVIEIRAALKKVGQQ